MTGRTILRVGTGDSQKIFHVERGILSGCTTLFGTTQPKNIEWPDEDPTAVEMFIDWAKRLQQPIYYHPGQYSEEPWISHAAIAWLLGHRIESDMFKRYALSQFIQNCALAARGPWKLIEEKSPAQSPLLRFSDHWVAWNSSLLGPVANEYAGLEAASRAHEVTSSTRDPRILHLDHWYMDCGNSFNSNCIHDPVFLELHKQKKRLKKRPPPAEWGADIEAKK